VALPSAAVDGSQIVELTALGQSNCHRRDNDHDDDDSDCFLITYYPCYRLAQSRFDLLTVSFSCSHVILSRHLLSCCFLFIFGHLLVVLLKFLYFGR